MFPLITFPKSFDGNTHMNRQRHETSNCLYLFSLWNQQIHIIMNNFQEEAGRRSREMESDTSGMWIFQLYLIKMCILYSSSSSNGHLIKNSMINGCEMEAKISSSLFEPGR